MTSNTAVWRIVGLLALLSAAAALFYALDRKPVGTTNTPMIYFAGGKGGEPDQNTCSFEIKGGQYKFNGGDNNNCTNDDMYWYRLDNAPSAALITFHAEDDCREGGDWYFRFRTYINPITVGWQKISDLNGPKPGDIVTKGIMFDGGEYNKGAVDGKISCVTIDY
ncbi:hypothetical protein [Pseudomonas sp. NPDC090592]|uniref:hypothetical protein n=1 Tax=Pseudomonas sp. NPDC090592 TaxID=3364480 RepID=UPI00383B637F